jgi:hypothetical protein
MSYCGRRAQAIRRSATPKTKLVLIIPSAGRGFRSVRIGFESSRTSDGAPA